MADARDLYNCCSGLEPDWREFAQLELGGCISHDRPHQRPWSEGETWTEGGVPAYSASFYTIYGRRHDGEAEAITDAPTATAALYVAGELALRSRLPVLVSPSLASTR